MSAVHSCDSSSWYTPPEIVDAAREALGGQIDLDPASCAVANDTVKAARFYSLEAGEDGLSLPWRGRVFLNPPSPPRRWWQRSIEHCVGLRLAGKEPPSIVYVAYSIEQLQQSQGWTPGSPMLSYLTCVPKKRIPFMGMKSGELVTGKQPAHANAIVGVNVDPNAFRKAFGSIGSCL